MKLVLGLLSSIGAQDFACKQLVGANSKCSNHHSETVGITLEECLQLGVCDTKSLSAVYHEEEKKCLIVHMDQCGTFLSGSFYQGFNLYDTSNCVESDRTSCADDGADDGADEDVEWKAIDVECRDYCPNGGLCDDCGDDSYCCDGYGTTCDEKQNAAATASGRNQLVCVRKEAKWSAYSEWTTCSEECGGGTQTQTRSCSTGSDADCEGSPINTQNCNEDACEKKKCGTMQTLVGDTCISSGCVSCPGQVNAECMMSQEQNWMYTCVARTGFGCVGANCFSATQCNQAQYDCAFKPDAGDGGDELGFPCPSTDCWDFKADSGTCELKALDSCTKVTCGATSMSMEIGSGVFADSDESMGLVEPALDDATDDAGTLGWVKSCDLDSDDCNMSHKVAGNDLIFTVQFSLKGKSRGRSDVEDKIIDLGDVQVNTAPFGIGVSFECTYGMTVDLTSNEYSVQEVTVSGTKTGDGSLQDGFTMTLNDDSGDALVLGSRLNVEVNWSLTLSDIDYYFQGCSVRHASNTDEVPTKVAVVKSGCYSEALHATRDTCSDDNGICMSFQTFTIEAEAGTDQIIGCTVQLCNSATADGCDGKTAPTCPAADTAYVYTIDGKA